MSTCKIKYCVVIIVDERMPEFVFPALDSLCSNSKNMELLDVILVCTKNSMLTVRSAENYYTSKGITVKSFCFDYAKLPSNTSVFMNVVKLLGNDILFYEKAILINSKFIACADVFDVFSVNMKNNVFLGCDDTYGYEGSIVDVHLRMNKEKQQISERILLLDINEYKESMIEVESGSWNIVPTEYLDYSWGFITSVEQDSKVLSSLRKNITHLELDVYLKATKDIKIVHYDYVPWHFPGGDYASYFWKYARKSNVYLSFLEKMQNDLAEWSLSR